MSETEQAKLKFFFLQNFEEFYSQLTLPSKHYEPEWQEAFGSK
jgi:hypothetical protein